MAGLIGHTRPTTHTGSTDDTTSIKPLMPATHVVRVAVIIGALIGAPALLFALSQGARSLVRGTVRGMTAVDVMFLIAGIIFLASSGLIVWRERRPGAALLMLRRSPYVWLYGALAVALIAVCAIRILNPHTRQPSMLFVALAWVVFCLVRIANRPRVCEQGIVDGPRFLPWQRIVSYDVRAGRHDGSGLSGAALTIEYYASAGPSAEVRSTTIRCSTARRGDIEILLARHVRTVRGHRRWHARRVHGAQAVHPSVSPRAVPTPPAASRDTMIAR